VESEWKRIRHRWKPLRRRWRSKGTGFSRNRCTDSSSVGIRIRWDDDGNNGEGKLALGGWSWGGGDGSSVTAEEAEEQWPEGDRGLPCNPNRLASAPELKSFSGAFPFWQFDFGANK
jgi:hypothetical protein